ncbi:MAG: hypothetical protein HRT44_09045, partial [Bdellovibrionales bacterium]|nr:hypothetical protein [Bdellovibrionales bacterium]
MKILFVLLLCFTTTTSLAQDSEGGAADRQPAAQDGSIDEIEGLFQEDEQEY